MTTSLITLNIGIVVPLFLGATFWVVPGFRRRSMLFGVRVSTDWAFSKKARRIVMTYRAQVLAWTLLGIALSFSGLSSNSGLELTAAPIILSVGGVIAFAIANRATNPHASGTPALRSASLAPSRENLPGGLLSILPLVILTVTAIWLKFHWDQIPERFPVHFDMVGNPNGWAHRTWRGVYGILLIGGSIVAMLAGVAAGIVRSSPRGSEWTSRFRKATLQLLIGETWIISLLFSYLAISPALGLHTGGALPLIAVLGATTALAVPVIRLGSDPGSSADTTPDDAWKMGLIYYNPGDPALMVEKRFGIGYTVNFGNKLAWVLMGMVAVIPFMIFVVVRT